MSDLESRLRSALREVPSPSPDATRRAREAALARRGRGRRIAWAAPAVAVLAAGAGAVIWTAIRRDPGTTITLGPAATEPAATGGCRGEVRRVPPQKRQNFGGIDGGELTAIPTGCAAPGPPFSGPDPLRDALRRSRDAYVDAATRAGVPVPRAWPASGSCATVTGRRAAAAHCFLNADALIDPDIAWRALIERAPRPATRMAMAARAAALLVESPAVRYSQVDTSYGAIRARLSPLTGVLVPSDRQVTVVGITGPFRSRAPLLRTLGSVWQTPRSMPNEAVLVIDRATLAVLDVQAYRASGPPLLAGLGPVLDVEIDGAATGGDSQLPDGCRGSVRRLPSTYARVGRLLEIPDCPAPVPPFTGPDPLREALRASILATGGVLPGTRLDQTCERVSALRLVHCQMTADAIADARDAWEQLTGLIGVDTADTAAQARAVIATLRTSPAALATVRTVDSTYARARRSLFSGDVLRLAPPPPAPGDRRVTAILITGRFPASRLSRHLRFGRVTKATLIVDRASSAILDVQLESTAAR